MQALRFTPWLALINGEPWDAQLHGLDYTPGVMNDINEENFQIYYNTKAVYDFNVSLPFGLTQDFAYQTFDSAKRNHGESQLTNQESVHAVVDALSLETECRELESWETSNITFVEQNRVYFYNIYNFSFSLQFESCDEPFRVKNTNVSARSAPWSILGSHTVPWWVMYENLENQPKCASLPQDYPPFMYFVAYYKPSPADENKTEVEWLSAVICSSQATISQVDVMYGGLEPKVTKLPNFDSFPTKLNMSPWKLIQQAIPDLRGRWRSRTRNTLGGASMYTWGPVLADMALRNQNLSSPSTEMYMNKDLEQAIQSLTKMIGPRVSHHRLRQGTTRQSNGNKVTTKERLMVNEGFSIATAVLFAMLASIGLWTMHISGQTARVLFRDPSTVLGNMLLSSPASSPATVLEMRRKEILERAQRHEDLQWSNSVSTPFILRPWFRLGCTLYTFSLIVGLAVALKVSKMSDGLTDVSDEEDYSLLWTSLPALLVLLVTLYCNLLDTTLRGLSMHYLLSNRPCTASEFDTSFLDMIGLAALWRALRQHLSSVAVTQILVIFCGFLTSVSTLLYRAELVPEHRKTRLWQQSFFRVSPGFGREFREPVRALFAVRNTQSYFP